MTKKQHDHTANTQLPEFEHRDILGMRIATLRLTDLLNYFNTCMAGQTSTKLVAYANAHSCNLFIEDRAYREAMNAMDLVYADGNGPRLTAWLMAQSMPPRMTGADWIDDLAALCSESGYRVFLLGGSPGVAEKAGKVLLESHPDLEIAGSHHGFFDSSEEGSLIRQINALNPDLIISGMGSPRQELWMVRNRQALNAPVIWGAGGVLDYTSGSVMRAPLCMRVLALEWLGRWLIEPTRLTTRYMFGIPAFLARSIRYAIQYHFKRLLKTGETDSTV